MSLNGVCRKSEFQTSARPYAILIFPEPGTQNPEGADEDVLTCMMFRQSPPKPLEQS